MARVAQDGAFLHLHHVRRGDDVFASGHGYKDIAQRGRLIHGIHVEAVHDRLHRAHRVDLADDDLGAQGTGPHGNALAAPAIAGHPLSGHDQVGGAHDAVPNRLAGAIAVVKHELHLGVVDADHGKVELSPLGARPEPKHAGGGLLASAHHAFGQIGPFFVQYMNQIAAVIDDDVGLAFKSGHQMIVIFLIAGPVPGAYRHALAGQPGGHVVLGGQGIGAGHIHFRAPGFH